MKYEKETAAYWSEAAGRFSENIRAELAGGGAQVWTELLMKNAPRREGLRVLDVGTGSGFFATWLNIRNASANFRQAFRCTESRTTC